MCICYDIQERDVIDDITNVIDIRCPLETTKGIFPLALFYIV